LWEQLNSGEITRRLAPFNWDLYGCKVRLLFESHFI
jgi:hypothetical protein